MKLLRDAVLFISRKISNTKQVCNASNHQFNITYPYPHVSWVCITSGVIPSVFQSVQQVGRKSYLKLIGWTHLRLRDRNILTYAQERKWGWFDILCSFYFMSGVCGGGCWMMMGIFCTPTRPKTVYVLKPWVLPCIVTFVTSHRIIALHYLTFFYYYIPYSTNNYKILYLKIQSQTSVCTASVFCSRKVCIIRITLLQLLFPNQIKSATTS